MKTLGIIWKVIINIITIAVVLGIFSIASSKFETIVLAVLVLIYLSLSTFTAIWGLHQIEFGEALQKQLDLIKRKLGITRYYEEYGNDDDGFTDKFEKEMETEAKEKKKTLMIKFYINVGFQTIIYIIALYNLLTVLNS